MKQQKMQNNLSEERLRKDNGHFLEITQDPFQGKALPFKCYIDGNLIIRDINASTA